MGFSEERGINNSHNTVFLQENQLCFFISSCNIQRIVSSFFGTGWSMNSIVLKPK